MDIKQFLKDRDAALLSVDENTIWNFANKYGVNMPKEPVLFWITVHKARTGARSLPMVERVASKIALHSLGFHSLDEGEVPYLPDDSKNSDFSNEEKLRCHKLAIKFICKLID